MAVSPSGLITLLALIFIGPVVYLIQHLFFKKKSSEDEAQLDHSRHTHPIPDDNRETMSTTAYTFGLVGYAIGIGNVWRFPYVISQNGGAAAVVAYLICAVLVAVPLFLYEMILGQYMRKSCVPAWTAIRPRYLSFGLAQGLMVFIANIYFAMIIAYTLPYIVSSVQSPLPWTVAEGGSRGFWNNDILNGYDDINLKPPGPGPIQWHLAVALLFLWTLIFFCITFGKKVLAKVTYVTVLMPVILLAVLVIRTAFLEGAGDGIAFYIGKFEASKLKDFNVWSTACSQILFSLSPGFGTAITYSSYCRPKEDVYRVCMITAVANSTFSLVGGFAIFAMVGNLAYTQGLTVEEVATNGGMGLAFVTIAAAMETFGGAKNVMSVLFFVMLLTLGLDSAFAWTETIVSIVEDLLEMGKFKKVALWKVTLGVCVVSFLLGLVYTTRAGLPILDVVDHYVGVIFLLLVCFIEAMILNFEFGWNRLALALQYATVGLKGLPEGRSIFPTYLCRFDFHVTVLLVPLALGLYTFVSDIQDPYGAYPGKLLAWGWGLLALCIVITLSTLWKCNESKLCPIEEDEERVEKAIRGEDGKAYENTDTAQELEEGKESPVYHG